MARVKTEAQADNAEPAVVVGWSATDYGPNLVLRLQGLAGSGESAGPVTEERFLIKKDHAVLLGNMLFEMSGRLPPRQRKRGVLDRLLGG